MNTPQTLGERLALLRGIITQSEFAEAIGISQNSFNVRFIEEGMIVEVAEQTDFWQSAAHNFHRDNGHFFYTVYLRLPRKVRIFVISSLSPFSVK